MQNITPNELVGLYENILVNDEKIENNKSANKMIQADSNQQFKEFAKDKELNVTDLKNSYKYYKKRKESGEDKDSEDYFTLISFIDNIVAHDNEEDD